LPEAAIRSPIETSAQPAWLHSVPETGVLETGVPETGRKTGVLETGVPETGRESCPESCLCAGFLGVRVLATVLRARGISLSSRPR
jgi:hypothetical protein